METEPLRSKNRRMIRSGHYAGIFVVIRFVEKEGHQLQLTATTTTKKFTVLVVNLISTLYATILSSMRFSRNHFSVSHMYLQFVCFECFHNFKNTRKPNNLDPLELTDSIMIKNTVTPSVGQNDNQSTEQPIPLTSTNNSMNNNEFANETSKMKNSPTELSDLMNMMIVKLAEHSVSMNMMNQSIATINENTNRREKDFSDKIMMLSNKIDEVRNIGESNNGNITDLQQKMSDLHFSGRLQLLKSKKIDTYKNTLDWNFSLSQSLDNRSSLGPNTESSELFGIVDNFERNTWTSFDALTTVLLDDSKQLEEIRTDLNSIDYNIQSFSLYNNHRPGNSFTTNNPKKEAMPQIHDNIENTNAEKSKIIGKKVIRHNWSGDGSRSLDEDQSSLENKVLKAMALNDDELSEAATPHNSQYIDSEKEGSSLSTKFNHDMADFTVAHDKNKMDLIHSFCELYTTKLPTSTTCDDVRRYLQSKNIDCTKTHIYRLTKKQQNLELLSFVSFVHR